MADAGDSIATDYMQFRRFSEQKSAGDALLSEYGLDATGQPLPKEQTQAGPATTAPMPVKLEPTAPATSPGIVTETGRALFGGAVDAVKEMIQSSGELAGWIEEKTGLPKGGKGAQLLESLLPEIQKNESTIGGMARGTTQFLTGYLTSAKALGGAAMATKAGPFLAGALSDITAFDPNDPNLSTMVEQLAPSLKDSIFTFLATDPKDSAAENRFKRAIEGAGLGFATNMIFGVVKHWRAARNVKKVEQAFEQGKAAGVIGEPPFKPGVSDWNTPSSTMGEVPFGPKPLVGPPKPLPIAAEAATQKAERRVIELAEQDRLLEGAVGRRAVTVGELTEAIEKEFLAEEAFRTGPEGAKALRKQLSKQDLYNRIRGNPTLQAAYETSLKGTSEEAMTNAIIAEERRTLEEILKSQKGEISPGALSALARGVAGAAIGITQGDTMQDRIQNALMLGGAAAAVKPAYVKRIVDALRKNVSRETKIIESFDKPKTVQAAPGMAVTPKGTPAMRQAPIKKVEIASEAQAKAFLEADPAAIQVGDKAIKINWSEVGDEQSIDDVIKTVTKLNEESIDVARRGTQTDVHSKQLAEMLGMTEDDMLRRRRGQALNDYQTRAFISIWGSANNELTVLARAVKSGEPVDAQFRAHLGKTTALTQEAFGARAEAGRALRVWAQVAQNFDVAGLQSASLAGKNAGDVTTQRLADMVLALEGSAQRATTMRQVATLGHSALLEAWINGLLSNPVTHVKNILSNSVVAVNGLIERQIAGMMGKEVARGEAGAMLHGLSGGWMDALSMARKALVTGESQHGFSKIDISHVPAITAENLGLSGPIGHGVDILGQFVRSPGRLLLAADDFFKAINYRMEAHALAYRQAYKEGGTDAAIKKRMGDLLLDDDFLSLTKDAAESFANYQTFNQALGKMGTASLSFINEHPWTRFVVPFVRTPINIAKYTLERTPILNLAMNQVRNDIAAGGIKRDMALAKMAYGGMMFVAAGSLAAAGYITGGLSKDPKIKQFQKDSLKMQEDSLKIGENYYSYKGLEPHGSFFGMAARIVELSSEATEFDLGTAALAATLAFQDTFIHKTYAQGLFDLFEAIRAPDRNWERYIEKLMGSVVPSGVAQIERTGIPLVYEGDPIIREADGIIETIMSRTPGLSTKLEPRLNIWAEPIRLEGGVGPDLVSPFYVSTREKDPVSDEMIRLELAPGMPPKYVFGSRPQTGAFAKEDPGQGIELTAKEYTRFVELSAGHGLQGAGKTLHGALENMMNGTAYKSQSDGTKKTAAQRIIAKYRDAAENQLIKESGELTDIAKEHIEARRAASRPSLIMRP